MEIVPPQPGQVIRYAYLWAEEAERGQEEGNKERPCAVVVAIQDAEKRTRVVVLPITHTPPIDENEVVALPQATKQRLGLDAEPSWVVISECNVFAWPGPDLRAVPYQEPATNLYGLLPARLYNELKARFLKAHRDAGIRVVKRTE